MRAIIQSYVTHKGKTFFVSTINRESSSMLGGTYAETLVWELDEKTGERKQLVGQDEGATDSIFAHQRMCERIYETGKTSLDDEE